MGVGVDGCSCKAANQRCRFSILFKIGFSVIVVGVAIYCLYFQTISTGDSAVRRINHFWKGGGADFEEHLYGLHNGTNNVRNNSTKTILLWTAWFGNRKWAQMFALLPNAPWITGKNPSQKCFVTTDRKYMKQADGVVFHGRDLSFNDVPNPLNRRPYWQQKWVFFLLESPVHSGLNSRMDFLNGIGFNWLMSYSRRADVFYPYGKFLPNDGITPTEKEAITKRIDNFVESFTKRPVDAVWIVSNCHASSKREYLVNKLAANGISVNTFGACSSTKPEVEWNQAGGYAQFFQRYRFYLSLENSLCDDYASEKLYNGFNASQNFGLIPIVYGGANYSAFLPNGSYVDALKFSTMSDLAGELKKIRKESDAKRLRRFFEWQYDYHISDHAWFRHENGWQTLCHRLWMTSSDDEFTPSSNNKKTQPYITDIKSRLGSCQNPPSLLTT